MAKNLSKYLTEMLNENKKSINDEKSFRDYAKRKFKEAFGDKLDEDEMNDVIDGILKNNESAVNNNDWGELVGILNKSF